MDIPHAKLLEEMRSKWHSRSSAYKQLAELLTRSGDSGETVYLYCENNSLTNSEVSELSTKGYKIRAYNNDIGAYEITI